MRRSFTISLQESKLPIVVPYGGKICYYKSELSNCLHMICKCLHPKKQSAIIFIRYMIAYTNLLRCIENLGIAGAYGIRYYGQGKITHDNYVQMIRHFTLVDEYLEQSKNYVPQIGKGNTTLEFYDSWLFR